MKELRTKHLSWFPMQFHRTALLLLVMRIPTHFYESVLFIELKLDSRKRSNASTIRLRLTYGYGSLLEHKYKVVKTILKLTYIC